MNPKISIITVSFNSEKTIEQTIKSVIEQGYENLEYILVDGLSNDGTLKIIKKYASEYPQIIKYISEKDSGIYDAMNKGILLSTGELIGIINSDDYYEPGSLIKVAEASREKRINDKYVVYGMTRFVDHEQEHKVLIYNHNTLNKQMMCHPSCFVSREVYYDIGLFDCNYKSAADYDLFLRMAESQKIEFIPLYEIIANFREGGMSGTYTSYKEEIVLRYKHGIITTNQYYFYKTLNYLKRRIVLRMK